MPVAALREDSAVRIAHDCSANHESVSIECRSRMASGRISQLIRAEPIAMPNTNLNASQG